MPGYQTQVTRLLDSSRIPKHVGDGEIRVGGRGCSRLRFVPRYHVLLWVVRRKDAFRFLLSDLTFDSKEMSASEIEMLSSVTDLGSASGQKFWATALMIQVLSDWGVSVSVWLHSCACTHHETKKEKDTCSLKGRRAVELALGQWRRFVDDLAGLPLTAAALEALSQLESSNQSQWGSFLLQSFQDCKSTMLMRCKQAWSFWGTLPFSILELSQHLLDPVVPESQSRARAKQLLKLYEATANKSELGCVSWRFFGQAESLRELRVWIHGGALSSRLKCILIGYSTILVVMQRLEAKHHLVNIAVSRGRAQQPPATMAALRRRANQDLDHPEFRTMLPELMQSFGDLVPSHWGSRKELLQQVYGFGLDQLHPDIAFEERQMARHAALTNEFDHAPSNTGQQVPPRAASWLRMSLQSCRWSCLFAINMETSC